MGAQSSIPKPGTTIQVIDRGLPRTGTASFSAALSILLNAPIYYGGTQATLGPPFQNQFWVSLLSNRPPQIPSDTYFINNILKTRLNGYSAVTDSPCNGLIPELLDLYPKAVVICTLRDPDAWVRSKETVSSAALLCLRALLDTRELCFMVSLSLRCDSIGSGT
ncbi:hypothetical protein SLS59_006606 [Nothophoma quercina]|uniref:Sulfotransferase n=1 Tax=Nothophoma quercina TaxID=749835 RepID=A0ABR3R405_9PLEO